VLVARAARIQIAVTASVYLLLQAVSIWLDQYSTLTDTNDLFTGAGYTDVNATIPGRAILAGIAAVVAILFLVTAVIGRWRLPVIGTALLIVSSLLLGSLYPWVVQRFQVVPSAKTLESPYIKRNIDLTRDAYGLAGVEEVPYNAAPRPSLVRFAPTPRPPPTFASSTRPWSATRSASSSSSSSITSSRRNSTSTGTRSTRNPRTPSSPCATSSSPASTPAPPG
jgi:hypothetical protein